MASDYFLKTVLPKEYFEVLCSPFFTGPVFAHLDKEGAFFLERSGPGARIRLTVSHFNLYRYPSTSGRRLVLNQTYLKSARVSLKLYYNYFAIGDSFIDYTPDNYEIKHLFFVAKYATTDALVVPFFLLGAAQGLLKKAGIANHAAVEIKNKKMGNTQYIFLETLLPEAKLQVAFHIKESKNA